MIIPRSHRVLGVLGAAFVALVVVTALLASTAHASTAHAAGSCSTPQYPGSGYFTSLKVTKTSCGTGRKIALAWYHCRLKNGVSGKCHSRVLGFSCTEKRVKIPTEFDARVTCHKGSATVIHTYQQNT